MYRHSHKFGALLCLKKGFGVFVMHNENPPEKVGHKSFTQSRKQYI